MSTGIILGQIPLILLTAWAKRYIIAIDIFIYATYFGIFTGSKCYNCTYITFIFVCYYYFWSGTYFRDLPGAWSIRIAWDSFYAFFFDRNTLRPILFFFELFYTFSSFYTFLTTAYYSSQHVKYLKKWWSSKDE